MAGGVATADGIQATTFDGDLAIEDGELLRLETGTSDKAYLVLVKRESGFDTAYVGGDKGSLEIDKEGLEEVLIYRLEPIAVWDDLGSRKCNDLPALCPLPPPPPDW
jgi:hypothetical protein